MMIEREEEGREFDEDREREGGGEFHDDRERRGRERV